MHNHVPVSFLVWLLSCLILFDASLCLSALVCITSLDTVQSEGAYLVGLASSAVAMLSQILASSVKILLLPSKVVSLFPWQR